MYSHTRKPTRHFVPIFLVRHSTKMDQKGKYLAQNDQNQKIYGTKQKVWYPHIGEPIRHLFRLKNIDRRGSNGLLGTKKCNIDPKILIIWDQKSIFCLGAAIFRQKNISPINSGVPRKKFHPQKNSVSEEGVIFRG